MNQNLLNSTIDFDLVQNIMGKNLLLNMNYNDAKTYLDINNIVIRIVSINGTDLIVNEHMQRFGINVDVIGNNLNDYIICNIISAY